MDYCIQVAQKTGVKTVDLTGGAPEMNPHFTYLVSELSKLGIEIIVRSNLTILVANEKYKTYPEFFKQHGVTVISSLPCYTSDNVDKQRGIGVFDASIKALKKLNEIGYGMPNSNLKLHLVYNPGGPSLPPPQEKLQADYTHFLQQNFGISFNNLYTITNIPISRFLDYLVASGAYEKYMQKLLDAFNPSAVNGVMCRNTVSVSWDGFLYDCDFNQMLDLKVQHAPTHIADFDLQKMQQRKIVVNQHCYGCTAGAGSSCQGSIV
jgi:radical SAM/Cys-rich protein